MSAGARVRGSVPPESKVLAESFSETARKARVTHPFGPSETTKWAPRRRYSAAASLLLVAKPPAAAALRCCRQDGVNAMTE